MATVEKNDRNSIQVIARAAAILRLLPSHPEGLTLGEIAEAVGLPRSTVQRIVKALSDEQFVVAASARGGIKLGPALIPLAAAAQTDIAQLVKPMMQTMSQAVNETVDLSILSGNRALFIAQVTGKNRLAALSSVGETFPLYSTANGKALLSCLPEKKRFDLLKETFARDTSNTMPSVEDVLAQIHSADDDGVFYDREEHTDGICAIGVAFIDAVGRAHALSCPVPQSRFESTRDKLRSNILSCRDRIVGVVGGKLP